MKSAYRTRCHVIHRYIKTLTGSLELTWAANATSDGLDQKVKETQDLHSPSTIFHERHVTDVLFCY